MSAEISSQTALEKPLKTLEIEKKRNVGGLLLSKANEYLPVIKQKGKEFFVQARDFAKEGLRRVRSFRSYESDIKKENTTQTHTTLTQDKLPDKVSIEKLGKILSKEDFKIVDYYMQILKMTLPETEQRKHALERIKTHLGILNSSYYEKIVANVKANDQVLNTQGMTHEQELRQDNINDLFNKLRLDEDKREALKGPMQGLYNSVYNYQDASKTNSPDKKHWRSQEILEKEDVLVNQAKELGVKLDIDPRTGEIIFVPESEYGKNAIKPIFATDQVKVSADRYRNAIKDKNIYGIVLALLQNRVAGEYLSASTSARGEDQNFGSPVQIEMSQDNAYPNNVTSINFNTQNYSKAA